MAFKRLFNMDACAVDKVYSEQLFDALKTYEHGLDNQDQVDVLPKEKGLEA